MVHIIRSTTIQFYSTKSAAWIGGRLCILYRNIRIGLL